MLGFARCANYLEDGLGSLCRIGVMKHITIQVPQSEIRHPDSREVPQMRRQDSFIADRTWLGREAITPNDVIVNTEVLQRLEMASSQTGGSV